MADAPSKDAPGRVPRFGPFAVAAVTMALVTWPIAFNLGAYDAVFYQDIFQFVVAATAGLAVTLITSPYRGRTLWLVRLALAAPAAWLALSVIYFDSTMDAAADPVFGVLGLVAAVVSIPTVLTLLMDLFVPELTSLRESRLIVAAVAVIVLIAVAGYAVGANNDAFLTCEDFTLAGSDRPANCAPG